MTFHGVQPRPTSQAVAGASVSSTPSMRVSAASPATAPAPMIQGPGRSDRTARALIHRTAVPHRPMSAKLSMAG